MKLIKFADDLYVPEDFSKNHYYFADAEGTKKYTGVSTVLDSIFSKPWLMKWSANMAVDAILAGTDPEEARTAYAKRSKDATDFGTDAHAEAERVIQLAINTNGGVINTTSESPQVKNLIKWAAENQVIFLACEKRLYSKEMWVAGTCDFVCKIGDKVYLGDLKTSKQISYDYMLQCAGYALMYPEKIDGTVIVRTGKGGKVWDNKRKTYNEVKVEDDFEVQYRHDIEGDKEAFMSALKLYRARADYGE